jgi:tellurite resistance protein TerC
MQLILSTFMAAWGQARRLIVFVIGGTVLLFGFALLVLPGPAFVVIPMGLGILSLEFVWARVWLRKLRRTAEAAAQRVREMATTHPNT